ncbi:16S rRNA (cytidine(1402)-2'-O)-methyltransferase [Listeria aquatica]|uniref:Ribosomal RNA small subunit methyltransferase I n=1 Tax=Listeria aquatica TaxID=1494960 RepID=A0A841ZSS5_9LIST|nr:16S rRNA (cytidine(1402)-2'-O)-methyltransferase [Listeria aquatica]MBC1521651.1 16S rRNA (cytidine(1402)-2'-O)-methyltransferase [Listeria aquatica]
MQSQKSFQNQDAGTLYLVPTPIGNLEDMTFRAVRMLKEVDLIAAEDTRNTIKLLNHFEIHTKMVSYHQYSERERENELVEQLQNGETIALVSDAGMPAISDPGYELVAKALQERVPVVALPGANAALTALIASGQLPQPFYFHGFLPRSSKERDETLAKLGKRKETWVLYESPHRLKETLKAILKAVGPERGITLCRELTKIYEEYLRGTVEEALAWSKEENVRGEFCLVVAGSGVEEVDEEAAWWQELSVREHVEELIARDGVSSKDAIKQVAKERNLPKREVYAAYHEIE